MGKMSIAEYQKIHGYTAPATSSETKTPVTPARSDQKTSTPVEIEFDDFDISEFSSSSSSSPDTGACPGTSSSTNPATVLEQLTKLCVLHFSGATTVHSAGAIPGGVMASVYDCKENFTSNRTLDACRAEAFAHEEKRHYEATGMYRFSDTPVVFCTIRGAKPRLILVDGQHRLHAWVTLGKPECCTWFVSLVECATEADVERHFVRINSGTPVPPEYYDKKAVAVIEAYLDKLRSKWPELEGGEKSQRPKYNRDVIRSKFLGACEGKLRVEIAAGRVDVDLLMLATEYRNSLMRREKASNHEWQNKSANKTAYTRAKRWGFYLGVEEERTVWPEFVALRALDTLEFRRGRLPSSTSSSSSSSMAH
jgi:hypothetical protein